MRQRLPFVLSVTALIVAVFGSTPLGEAAGKLTGPDGKLATSFGTIGPVGPAGPPGPPGDTSKLLGRTVTVTASRAVTTGARYDFVLCPSGYEAVGGGAYQENYRSVGTGPPPVFLLASGPTTSAGSFLADGPGGPAAGWGAMIVRASGPADTIHWSAVCAKEGG